MPCSMFWAFQSQSSAMGMLEILSAISDLRSHSLKTLPCTWCLVIHTGQFSTSVDVSVTKVHLCVCLQP